VEGVVVESGDDFIVVSFDGCRWFDREEFKLGEKDYRVGGDVWRVNKYDVDPYPSAPHAHCIGGRQKLIGCKLHLGTRQLFTANNKPLNMFLDEDQFCRLLELIRPKFPGTYFPLDSEE